MDDALKMFRAGSCVELSDDPRRNQLQIQIVELIWWSEECAELVEMLCEFFDEGTPE